MEGGEPIHVDVWGSCVPRDSLRIGGGDDGFLIENYFQLGSHPLQFTEHRLEDLEAQDFTDVKGNAPKKWLMAMWNHQIVPVLDSSSSEWLILDARPYAYGTVGIPSDGGYEYISRSDLRMISPILEKKKILMSPDEAVRIPEDDPAVEEGFQRFVKWCRERYGDKIILVEFFESPWELDENGDAVWRGGSSQKIVKEAYFNQRFHYETGCFVVRSPMNVSSDAFHKWGYSHVHYSQEFYDHVYRSIRTITDGNAPRCEIESKLTSIYLESSFKITSTMFGDALSKVNTVSRAKEKILDKEPESAWRMLKKLAKDCDDARFDLLADFFIDGTGSEISPKLAFPALDDVLDSGQMRFHEIFRLVCKYGTESECARVVQAAIPYAEEGKKDALACLALAHSNGCGIEKDYSKSKSILKKLVEEEYRPARTMLFDVIWDSNSEDDYGLMIQSVQPLLEKNDVEALRRMVNAYEKGRGVERDYDKALELLAVPLKKKTRWAPLKFFDLVWKSKKKEEYARAVDMMRTLAKSGNGYAMGRLARAYRDGRGVKRDIEASRRWYSCAIEKGVPWAQAELDRMNLENSRH